MFGLWDTSPSAVPDVSGYVEHLSSEVRITCLLICCCALIDCCDVFLCVVECCVMEQWWDADRGCSAAEARTDGLPWQIPDWTDWPRRSRSYSLISPSCFFSLSFFSLFMPLSVSACIRPPGNIENYLGKSLTDSPPSLHTLHLSHISSLMLAWCKEGTVSQVLSYWSVV